MTGFGPHGAAFADELAGLKRRGCALLVVDQHEDAPLCEELLGHPDEPRRRIVVDAGPDRPAPGEDRVVVDAGSHFARSAASSPSPPGCDSPVLPEVSEEIADHVDRFDAAGLEPGELRVCMGDIASLALGSDPGTLLDFLADVTELVREVSGMGHVHATPDAASRQCIEDLFDVTVTVRNWEDDLQYRWYLHDADMDSGWIALK